MTTIKIETKQKLILFYQLISAVKAKGKQSRSVAKFNKLLIAKCIELEEDEKELIAQYYEVEEDGNAKKDDSGTLVLLENADKHEYDTEWSDLHNEAVVIDLTEFQPYVEPLIKGLEDWDQELSGNDAIIYDELLDLLETIEPKDAD